MSTVFRSGLVLLGILSLGDLASPLLTDGNTPPIEIALIGSALGLLSLVFAVLAWRGSVGASVAVIVMRLLSALTAVPAFLFEGVPLLARVLAGVAISVTVVGVALVLAGLRRPVWAVSR